MSLSQSSAVIAGKLCQLTCWMLWAVILWWAQEVGRWWGCCPGCMKTSMKNGFLTRPGKSSGATQVDMDYFINFADVCNSELQQHFVGHLLGERDGKFCCTVRAAILVPDVEENHACLTFAYIRSTMCRSKNLPLTRSDHLCNTFWLYSYIFLILMTTWELAGFRLKCVLI